MSKTLFDIVKECDSFPYYAANPTLYSNYLPDYYKFKVANYAQTLGHVPKSIVESFDFTSTGWTVDHESKDLTLGGNLHNDGTTEEKLTALISTTLKEMASSTAHPLFSKLAKSWRNETFPITVTGTDGAKATLLEIERSASALFGILTSGVQVTCYVTHPSRGLLLWIGRRSRAKQTYPGMLDNTAAGGLETELADRPLEAAIRETVQEASLDETFVRGNLKSGGAISYYHAKPFSHGDEELGLLQPEIEYVYSLELSPDMVPVPGDGEVEEFYLWTVNEVLAALKSGGFKLNSAVAIIDFLIRRGVITAENERDYGEIVSRLHRILEIGC
ncbi:thiamine pyrophosphokinase-related protein [Aspergillus filifer]